jgi:transcriptional regulator with XRE-family HTH domain
MSDLYLVLRSRLESMPEWVYIDSDILREARERRGLSYETMARTLPVSSKTWERYEKAGRIPRPLLAKAAGVLELEIEEPIRRRIQPVMDSEVDLAAVLARVEALQVDVVEVGELLRRFLDEAGEPGAARYTSRPSSNLISASRSSPATSSQPSP